MSNRFAAFGVAAVLAALFNAASPPGAFAQDAGRGLLPPKHDSNTLHKIGKAIQYPVRKAGENTSKSTRKGAKDVQYGTRKSASNLSIDTHRATGHNSVERRRNGYHRHNTVVTPGGDLKRIH